MAKTKRRRRGKGISAYFRQIFHENPALLYSKSNEELRARWLKDHPGYTEVPTTVVQNLNNLKSLLRRQNRKSGVKPHTARAADGNAYAARRGGRGLMALEESIDECLFMAKNLDRPGLSGAIQHLRDARNEVVRKLGM